MTVDFDLSRALFLTYVGVGAAFLVLGSMVIFTGIIGRWGHWRLRRAEARAEALAAEETPEVTVPTAEGTDSGVDRELAAAIGVAVALAVEAHRRNQAAEEARLNQPPRSDGEGWKEQGRMVAFDARRIRDRDR